MKIKKYKIIARQYRMPQVNRNVGRKGGNHVATKTHF